jgi:type III pantothenate kinase
MILGIDIGNTSTLIGVYDISSAIPLNTFRFPTDRNSSLENISVNLKNITEKLFNQKQSADIKKICVSSVVPEINSIMADACIRLYEICPHFISSVSNLKIKISYTNPEELGPDRISNAEAANAEYTGDKLIIDLGTAMTFSVVLKNGIFDGGMILPGTSTAIHSLASRTSKLPKIELGIPERISARSTEDAIKSGIYFGWISIIEGISEKLESFYGFKLEIILTGGYSEIISRGLKLHHIPDPMLTMKGIKYIADIN